jgi:hypothetical protein
VRLIDVDLALQELRKRREKFASAWTTFNAMPDSSKVKYEENLECSLIIGDSPQVDAVEVVHGRWIRRIVDISAPYHTKDECSVCHWEGEVYYRYCPGCGAKMDGERREGE